MKKAKFYLIFHYNLAFSSIEEEQLTQVINKSYFPLLETIKSTNTKTGIELSGYTLEKLIEYSPLFVDELKVLIKSGLVELIGSGYQQIIGPIVPYLVNVKNQQLGLKVYKRVLGIKPSVAFLNEQVFSKSMVDVYKKFYDCICMEWNNPYSINASSWDESFGFAPAIAKGVKSQMPVIWTSSILFQQFQRTATALNTLENYLSMIERFINKGYKYLPIYSSDVEIFNFRPGRFHTENTIVSNEWENIKKIILALKNYGEFLLPSEILQFVNKNVVLDLTHPSQPIIVKKQPKYSLSRWSVAGLGGHYINTLSHNCYENIKAKADNNLWKNLLKFWGSDYRTHTTLNKWQDAVGYLKKYNCEYKIGDFLDAKPIDFDKQVGKITIKSKQYSATFLITKGLALESVYKNKKKLLFGSVNHGELDYISHGADYYTGTTTIESCQFGRLTNLSEARSVEVKKIGENKFFIKGTNYLSDWTIEEKLWVVDFDSKKIVVYDTLELSKPTKASIRMSAFTLLPVNKNSKFWYACKNGGYYKEKFFIGKNTSILHHLPISILQSSNGGLGVTNGHLSFGIGKSTIAKLFIDRAYGSPLVLLQNSPDHDKYLTRVFFSVQEFDDTLKPTTTKFKISYSIFF
ncbi:Alpha amylase domain protein [Desulfurella amilsii]|uniref:Alpha amylase domain protein n=1 Tax=Desulfurella amilsii TaxID=1562698 RepID=A0A1X4XUH5_9BACT|nr:hypothetical protein [Desulfurella amilsii]OSS41180.1 Alpha amylase domain protein [Desulfurella amilsii]